MTTEVEYYTVCFNNVDADFLHLYRLNMNTCGPMNAYALITKSNRYHSIVSEPTFALTPDGDGSKLCVYYAKMKNGVTRKATMDEKHGYLFGREKTDKVKDDVMDKMDTKKDEKMDTLYNKIQRKMMKYGKQLDDRERAVKVREAAIEELNQQMSVLNHQMNLLEQHQSQIAEREQRILDAEKFMLDREQNLKFRLAKMKAYLKVETMGKMEKKEMEKKEMDDEKRETDGEDEKGKDGMEMKDEKMEKGKDMDSEDKKGKAEEDEKEEDATRSSFNQYHDEQEHTCTFSDGTHVMVLPHLVYCRGLDLDDNPLNKIARREGLHILNFIYHDLVDLSECSPLELIKLSIATKRLSSSSIEGGALELLATRCYERLRQDKIAWLSLNPDTVDITQDEVVEFFKYYASHQRTAESLRCRYYEDLERFIQESKMDLSAVDLVPILWEYTFE